MSVILGFDPHKATHTAVAIDGTEAELSRAKVRATRKLAEGKTKKDAVRSPKRHISNAVYRQLHIDANRAT